ncbi:hypothetical protein MRX96_003334 [Rhipicephalus microplus]
MANQLGSNTDQYRRHQERLQSTQHHRAEHYVQLANDREDENSQRGTYDEHPVGLVTGPLMWPIMAQPFFYVPPSNAAVYRPVLPQYDPYVPVVQDQVGSWCQNTFDSWSRRHCGTSTGIEVEAKDHSVELA